MKTIKPFLYSVLLFLALGRPAMPAETLQKVLCLHSYDPSYEWEKSVDAAIDRTLLDGAPDVEIFHEYMDALRIPDPAFQVDLFNYLKSKYRDIRFNVVLASDNNALNFLLNYRDWLLGPVPVVFLGINNFSASMLRNQPLYTGVAENIDMAETLETALRLMPHLRKFIVYASWNTTFFENKSLLKQAVSEKGLPVEIELLENLPLSRILAHASGLGKDAAVIFLTAVRDDDGNHIPITQAIRMISKAAPVPTFSFWDFALGKGVVGGKLVSGQAQGKTAARLALRILNGEAVTGMPVIEKSPNRFMFDYVQLKRFSIPTGALPENSRIINQPETFFYRNKTTALTVFVIFCGTIATIGVLLSAIVRRKRAEESIRRISAAVEQSPASIVITDLSGAIEYVNPIFSEITGYSFAEAMGKNPRILQSGEFPPESYKVLWDTILSGRTWRGEFHNRKKNGELFWEQASISPVKDALGAITSFVAVKEDITERKRVEAELLRLNETLEQRVAQEVKKNLRHELLLIQQSRLAAMGEMIGNIAHQWRQPLNALGLLLFNIKDAYRFDALDAAYLEQAVLDGNRLVQKMSTTISDFSNFFRPDKEKRVFSALEQIREAVALVEAGFQTSDIPIHIDAPQDVNLMGFANEYSQVLLNMLSNAREAILARGHAISGRVDIVLSEQDGMGCVSVCDNGGGIPANILERIFDPYFSTKEKGSGIGLYMSKMIIERNMNGAITAANIAGGAAFRICVPLARDNTNGKF